MASEAQILANRKNAEKSTGPRTAEGKAASSQNAVKHGLLARNDILSSEDPGEFEVHHEQMLKELNPAGAVESVLAERIVGLSWRLKRAERIQNQVFDYLLASEELGSFGENDQTASPAGGGDQPSELAHDPDLLLGRAVLKDFAEEGVLEKLLVYERRIEHSLYRAISELRSQKLMAESESWRRVMGRPAESASRPSCETNPIPTGPVNPGDARIRTLGVDERRFERDRESHGVPWAGQRVDMRPLAGDNAERFAVESRRAVPMGLEQMQHGLG
jgi:hypothetical protein